MFQSKILAQHRIEVEPAVQAHERGGFSEQRELRSHLGLGDLECVHLLQVRFAEVKSFHREHSG